MLASSKTKCLINSAAQRFNFVMKFVSYAVCMIAGMNSTAFAMGGQPGGGSGQPQSMSDIIMSFAPLLLIFVIFYFLLIRPQSKKAKEHKDMLDNLKKGDKVMTNGGIYGIIEDIDTETATLKVGVKEDVRIKVNRAYIAGLRTKE